MRKALAVIVLVVVLAVAVAAAFLLARSPESQPYTLRLWALEWVPGWLALARWEARRDAKRHSQQGLRLVYGYPPGIDLLFDDCEVVDYQRGMYDRSDLPKWLNVLGAGAAVVECGEEPLGSFNLIEVVGTPKTGYVFGEEYNRQMLTIARTARRTSNTPLKLTVTSLACARAAPAA